MSDADKFQRAIELARRAGALEHELSAVKRELAELAGDVAGSIPLPPFVGQSVGQAIGQTIGQSVGVSIGQSAGQQVGSALGQPLGSALGVKVGDEDLKAPLQARVMSVFRQHPTRSLTAAEVAKALHEVDKTKLISAYLTRFMQQGQLRRLGRGSYTLPKS